MSSENSMPSVRLVGSKASSFSTLSLSGTMAVMLRVPSVTVLRSAGQTREGSLVESPGLGSWAMRLKRIGSLATRPLRSSLR